MIYAKGYVLKHQDKYLAGILLDIDGYKLDVTVSDQVFLTSEACEVWLTQEMPNIVADLCDRMGLKQVKANFYGAGSQGSQETH